MNIEIGEKLMPFSHTPGTRLLVPGSDWAIQAFPALIRVLGKGELPLSISGPVKEFTVQLDLERDCVWIWGIAAEGYFRLKFQAEEGGLFLYVDRAPQGKIEIGGRIHPAKEKTLLFKGGAYLPPARKEKLSLGSFKTQDWDLAIRRGDLREIAPMLFSLGQRIPASDPFSSGALELKENIALFIQAGFNDLLYPTSFDERHLGLMEKTRGTGNPLSLLQAGYQQIRSLLLNEKGQELQVLPHLPSEWDAGKATHLSIVEFGEIDLEWSRNEIRSLVLRTSRGGPRYFRFAKPVSTYRLNGHRLENGQEYRFDPMSAYRFDRFEK